MPVCRRCKRPLTDTLSIVLGVGPKCRILNKNEFAGNKTMDIFGNADFEYQMLNDVVVIYDLNLGGRSVTNDVHNVLESIEKDIGDFKGKRIIYRDSHGVFDGITISGGEFYNFYTLNVKTLDAAMKKLNRNNIN
ncbi:MAG: DUF6011 domain-containing protein [Pseudomonadota bacterium]